MKKIVILSAIAFGFAITACTNSPKGEAAATTDAVEAPKVAASGTYKVDPTSSTLTWVGSKPGGEHTGIVALKEGALNVEAGNVVGGLLTFDMATISSTDLEGEWKDKLDGHLKAPDFFDVAKFPTATFEVTNVSPLVDDVAGNTHAVAGNFTLKGISKNITFPAKIEAKDGMITASAPQFLIDRTDWKVEFGSKKLFPSIKDNIVNENIGLSFTISAKL